MEDDQRSARIFGVLFLLTFLTSIPALLLFQPVLDDPAGYIAGDGKDTQIYLGAFLEFLLIIANVGTAVVLYPIARRQNPDASDLARSLAALKDWSFLLGPGLVVPFGNGLILGYLMYASGLVPRWMPWLGLIGGPRPFAGCERWLVLGRYGPGFLQVDVEKRGSHSTSEQGVFPATRRSDQRCRVSWDS